GITKRTRFGSATRSVVSWIKVEHIRLACQRAGAHLVTTLVHQLEGGSLVTRLQPRGSSVTFTGCSFLGSKGLGVGLGFDGSLLGFDGNLLGFDGGLLLGTLRTRRSCGRASLGGSLLRHAGFLSP